MPTKTKPLITLIAAICLLFVHVRAADTPATPANAATQWFSLDGKPTQPANTPDAKGILRTFNAPVLGVTRSTLADVHGTILLFPGGAYHILDILNEGARTAKTLNSFGYDVVMLEYHFNAGPTTRDLALQDAQTAWQLLKQHPDALNIHTGRLDMMGYSAGGHLAARLIQNLPPDQQPNDLILAYPAYLNERARNSDTPAVQPPAHPKSRLLAIMAANDRPGWLQGCQDYVNAFSKAGGVAIFIKFKTGGHGFGMNPNLTGDIAQWPSVLNYLLQNGDKPGVGPFNTYLPWFVPNVKGRMATFAKDKQKDQHAIVFLGDSITRKWNLDAAFPTLKVANRGISGDTTRGMFCRLQDNVLDLHPKAIVFMGGINDFTQQPVGTPENIATNLRSILQQVQTTAPATPVFVCQILPSHSVPLKTIEAANTLIEKVTDDFKNAHLVKTFAPFLNSDGAENNALFLDGTHPNPKGYEIWKSILAPELTKYVPSN